MIVLLEDENHEIKTVNNTRSTYHRRYAWLEANNYGWW